MSKGRSNHVDLRRLAQRVAIENGFNPKFNLDAINQIRQIEKSANSIVANTDVKDLTDILWSSIDNTESKDLDQIEYAMIDKGGETRVMVGIADVDAMVPKGSAIDLHASDATTSLYTGVAVFPMLPEELSEDITSLREGAQRLAIIMDMTVDADGAIKNAEFYRARVKNHAKLAYTALGKWFDHEADTPGNQHRVAGLEKQLLLQKTESEKFQDLRHRKGSLNLETIEARAVTSQEGDVIDIVTVEDNPARELIENFMVAANSALAGFLEKHGVMSIRRIVKTPKRWPRIVEVAAHYGFKLPVQPDPKALSEFLKERRQKDPLHFPDLSLTIVKLLGRGEYTVVKPGQQHEGHFGLGLHDYTHSTAPNRRFADLVAQRLLKALLAGNPTPYTEAELNDVAKQCTMREDQANKIERFMRKAAAAVFLSERIGQRFDAIVTGVKDDATYVRVLKPSVEGRIVKGEHGLDVGDKVNVKLVATDPERGFIDFSR